MKLKATLEEYNSKYYGTNIRITEDDEYIGTIEIWNTSHHNTKNKGSIRESDDEPENSHWESEHAYNVAIEIIKRINGDLE